MSQAIGLLTINPAPYIPARQGGTKLADDPKKPSPSKQDYAALGKRISEAYKPVEIGQAYTEMAKRLTEKFKPIQIRTDFGMGDAVKRISESLSSYTRNITAGWQQALSGFQTMMQNVLGDLEKLGRLEPTGWLPHSSTPVHLLEVDTSVDELKASVEQHYDENWPEIKAQFVERIGKYDLDDEAKETFLEALSAHETGHYRSVVRLLFPEFERVACKEFYQGKLYEPPTEGETQGKQITSLTGFRDSIGELPLGDVIGFDYGYHLYKKLDSHLYSSVGSSKSRIRRCQNDPVPNRNASLHGIVSYKSFQNSMNMLIMADYIYHLFSVMKAYLIEEESDNAETQTTQQTEGI